jgi:hypothetical protein
MYCPEQDLEILIEPTNYNRNLLVASTLSNSGNIVLQVVNDSNKPVRLRKNHHIGNALEFQSVLSPRQAEVYDVRTASSGQSKTGVKAELSQSGETLKNALLME